MSEPTPNPSFIHLRVHSDFSMVDGLKKVKPIVAKAAELNMPAIALTDQTNLCGLVKFYGEAHNQGIKPIVGCDFFVQSVVAADSDSSGTKSPQHPGSE